MRTFRSSQSLNRDYLFLQGTFSRPLAERLHQRPPPATPVAKYSLPHRRRGSSPTGDSREVDPRELSLPPLSPFLAVLSLALVYFATGKTDLPGLGTDSRPRPSTGRHHRDGPAPDPIDFSPTAGPRNDFPSVFPYSTIPVSTPKAELRKGRPVSQASRALPSLLSPGPGRGRPSPSGLYLAGREEIAFRKRTDRAVKTWRAPTPSRLH